MPDIEPNAPRYEPKRPTTVKEYVANYAGILKSNIYKSLVTKRPLSEEALYDLLNASVIETDRQIDEIIDPTLKEALGQIILPNSPVKSQNLP